MFKEFLSLEFRHFICGKAVNFDAFAYLVRKFQMLIRSRQCLSILVPGVVLVLCLGAGPMCTCFNRKLVTPGTYLVGLRNFVFFCFIIILQKASSV